MAHIIPIIVSILLGILLGILYGLSFRWAKAFYTLSKKPTVFIIFALTSILRISIFGTIFFYLLRIPSIQIILVVVPFFLTVWILILKNKALYG